MADRLVKITTFVTSEEAHMAKMLLSESNINSVVLGENLLMIAGNAGLPRVELHASQSQAKEAVEILESQRNHNLYDTSKLSIFV